MQAELKQQIVGNPFLDQIRDARVSRAAFSDLVTALTRLKDDWRGEDRLDREVVEYLHLLPSVTAGTAAALREAGYTDEAGEVDGMAAALDGLVLEVFSARPRRPAGA